MSEDRQNFYNFYTSNNKILQEFYIMDHLGELIQDSVEDKFF